MLFLIPRYLATPRTYNRYVPQTTEEPPAEGKTSDDERILTIATVSILFAGYRRASFGVMLRQAVSLVFRVCVDLVRFLFVFIMRCRVARTSPDLWAIYFRRFHILTAELRTGLRRGGRSFAERQRGRLDLRWKGFARHVGLQAKCPGDTLPKCFAPPCRDRCH